MVATGVCTVPLHPSHSHFQMLGSSQEVSQGRKRVPLPMKHQPSPSIDRLLRLLSKLGCLPVGFAIGWSAPASTAWPTQGQVRHSKGFHEVTLGGSGRKAGSAKRVSFGCSPAPVMPQSPAMKLACS